MKVSIVLWPFRLAIASKMQQVSRLFSIINFVYRVQSWMTLGSNKFVAIDKFLCLLVFKISVLFEICFLCWLSLRTRYVRISFFLST